MHCPSTRYSVFWRWQPNNGWSNYFQWRKACSNHFEQTCYLEFQILSGYYYVYIYIVHFWYISIHILSTKVVWLERPLTKNTWEPETSLPQELVADYEAGFLQEVQRETFTTGGRTIRTLSTAPTKEVCKESRAKCPKIDSPDTLNLWFIRVNDHTLIFTVSKYILLVYLY